jgi:hypothetical protein
MTKLVHFYRYKRTVFHKLYDTNHEARVNFVNWYLYVVYAGEIDPTFFLFSEEVNFISVDT